MNTKYKGLTLGDLKNMLAELDAKMLKADTATELSQLLLARSAVKDSMIEHLEYENSVLKGKHLKRVA